MHITEHTCISVLFIKESVLRLALNRLSMSEMVISHDIPAPAAQILCKFIISLDILYHSVAKLQNGTYVSFRFPFDRMDLRVSVL